MNSEKLEDLAISIECMDFGCGRRNAQGGVGRRYRYAIDPRKDHRSGRHLALEEGQGP